MSSRGDSGAALALLRATSRALSGVTGVDAVLDTLMERALATADASGVVFVAAKPGDTLEVLATTYGEQSQAILDDIPLRRPRPLTDAIREGRPVWLRTRDELVTQYPDLRERAESAAFVAVPLRVSNRVIGALGIGFGVAQAFDEPQRLYVLTLADLCAMVLDRQVLEHRRSEHRLRALVDSNVIGVIGGDLGRIREANDAFLDLVGLDAKVLDEGIDFRAITAPEYRDVDDRAVARADTHGRFGPYEKEFVHRAGHRVPARIVGAIISTSGKGRWIALVESLAEVRAHEADLRAATARLESLMRHAPVGFAFIDSDLRFQVVNDKFAELNGLPARSHLGRDVREVVPHLSGDNETLLRRVLNGEAPVETEVYGATPAAPEHRRDWLVNYYPVRDERGRVLGIGTTVVDVTERNQLLQAERTARASAEISARLSTALSSISAAISHADADEAIAHAAGRGIADSLAADAVLAARCDQRGRITEVLFTQGYRPEDIAQLRGAEDPDAWSTKRALSDRAPVFYEARTEFLEQFPTRTGIVEEMGAQSWAVVPLIVGDEPIGFLAVMFRSPHTFRVDERRFIATAGDVVAQAMLRARSRAAEVQARRAAETLAEAIAAERARLAAVLQRMPAGLVVVDAIGTRPRVVLSNSRAADILGPLPPDADADAWFAFRTLDGGVMATDATPLHAALRGDDSGDDALVVCDDGTTRRVRTTGVPVRDGDGRITGAVLVVEDVTDHARRQRDAQLLARVSNLLGPTDEVDVLERVVSLAVPDFADMCGLHIVDHDLLYLFAVADREPARAAQMRHLLRQPVPVVADRPLTNTLRLGEARLIAKIPEAINPRLLAPDQRTWVENSLRPRSVMMVPLRTGDHVTGVLTFTNTYETGRTFTPDDLAVANELANRSSLLVDQVIAHRQTARARDRADRLQRFAASMARAASVDAVAQGIVSEGAEAVDADMVRLLIRPPDDPAADVVYTDWLAPRARLVWKRLDPRVEDVAVSALRTGRTSYYASRAEFRRRFDDKASRLPEGMHAVAALPMLGSDGRVIAAISFAFATAHSFDDGQRGLIETVADVAAQSLDRARLFERERDVARALQLALLPSALPELDDVATEARYVAGGSGVSVGGDWYDVLRFVDGRVGLLIGDAAGRGVEAATLMGKVRHAAAALAMDRDSPAAVLARVNEYLHTISNRRTMLTCCYVLLDRDRGTLTYASAGHPPPVVIEEGGDPHFLFGGRGVPLGVVPTAVYSDAEYRLRGGTTIVLYTDGLIERRGETIDAGLDRLLDAIRDRHLDVRALCDHLTETLLLDGGDDDVALLAARVQSVASSARLELELPADSRRLHELRARVTRWLTDTGVEAGVIPDLVVALNEAVSNSMRHAYAGSATRGHVRISITLSDEAINATVADEGTWRDPADAHDGRGIDLMQSLMSDVRVERRPEGTRVHLVRSVQPVP